MKKLRRHSVHLSVASALMAAWSPQAFSGSDAAETLLEAMGGRAALEAVESMVLRGEGTRTRLGQMVRIGAEDPTARLVNVTETIDLANGRSAFDYEVVIDGYFQQDRTEVLTTFNGEPVGWSTTSGRPNYAHSTDGLFSWGPQNSPEFLLRRNIITIALAAADSAEAAAEEREIEGRTALFTSAQLPSGEEIGLYFNPETGLLDAFEALDTETMLGDVQTRYILDDYRAVDGLTLPHSLTVLKDGEPYSTMQYSSIAINDGSALEIFELPDDVVEQAEQVVASGGSWVPLELERVAPNVYQVMAFSHNGMVVEYPQYVAVVEAPYTEGQSLALARLIEEQIGKPIRYVVPTHFHYDHVGGVRALAALGATVIVAAGHEAEMRRIVESTHSNPPDELERRRAAGEPVGEIEIFDGELTLADGGQRLVLYQLDAFEHVVPMVLAYVPAARVLFQSDLYFGQATPDAQTMVDAVRGLRMNVETVVAGHGPAVRFRDVVTSLFR